MMGLGSLGVLTDGPTNRLNTSTMASQRCVWMDDYYHKLTMTTMMMMIMMIMVMIMMITMMIMTFTIFYSRNVIVFCTIKSQVTRCKG